MLRFARRSSILLAAAALLIGGPLSAADRYVAWLADGTKLSTNFIPAWPVPGVPYRMDNADLLDSKNPVRLLRDRTLPVTLRAPYLVLANGDILSGGPVALETTQGRQISVPRVRVQLEPPLMPVVGTGLSVRTDRIQRIVGSLEAARTNPPPGTVVLNDGRRFAARSIRWREAGLAILTGEGIVEAAYGDLADVVFPDVDRTAAVLDDNLWAGGNSSTAIVRFQMAGGSVVTATRVRREIEQSRRRRLTTTVHYYVQPAWCDQPIALPELQVAACGYRRSDEAPLSLLPATTVINQRLIGKVEPWQANRAPDGGLLSAAGRDSDLGISAHAHSAIAFTLPDFSRTLELAVAMDKSAGRGGCVRCKVLAENEQGTLLWDTGIFTGRDGFLEPRPLNVAGLSRVVLVTEYAHEDRPEGADPLDIRDQVVWLSPTVKLDLDSKNRPRRVASLFDGLDDWQLVGSAWSKLQFDSRWNLINRSWDFIAMLPRGVEPQLRRQVQVSRANDVLELLVACPANRDEHDFSLTVNGTEVDPCNNAELDELRKKIQYFGRLPRVDELDDAGLSDCLAYWWDLSRWRGQEVTVELTLRGSLDLSEIAWRNIALRSAISNLPAGGQPLPAQVALTSVTPLDADQQRSRGNPLPNAVPATGSGRYGAPIRFLGQTFNGGYGMRMNSSISFPLKSEYVKFVAVAGCCLHVAGPLQVLIDDRIVWERSVFNSLTPAEQIEIDIPIGAKKLTLLNGRPENSWHGYAAWAEAGFVTKP